MKFKNLSLSVLIVSGLIISGLSLKVQAEEHFEHQNYYATIGAGYSFLEKDEEVLGQQLYEVRAGMRANENWSYEAGFGIMPDVRRREFREGNYYTLDDDTSGFRFVVDALYHLENFDSHEPYIAFGGGLIHYNKALEDDHTDLFLSSGVGTFININKNWFVKPDYRVAMVGHDTEVNHTALFSIGYRFGNEKYCNSSNKITNSRITSTDTTNKLYKVHFAFDSSYLDEEARKNLNKNISWLKNNPNKEVVIEGHCDERGTTEYNLALGSQRAQAVYRYLTVNGVSKERLRTVSYGEEMPIALGHNEKAWAKNRRVEFSLDGKGKPKI